MKETKTPVRKRYNRGVPYDSPWVPMADDVWYHIDQPCLILDFVITVPETGPIDFTRGRFRIRLFKYGKIRLVEADSYQELQETWNA